MLPDTPCERNTSAPVLLVIEKQIEVTCVIPRRMTVQGILWFSCSSSLSLTREWHTLGRGSFFHLLNVTQTAGSSAPVEPRGSHHALERWTWAFQNQGVSGVLPPHGRESGVINLNMGVFAQMPPLLWPYVGPFWTPFDYFEYPRACSIFSIHLI